MGRDPRKGLTDDEVEEVLQDSASDDDHLISTSSESEDDEEEKNQVEFVSNARVDSTHALVQSSWCAEQLCSCVGEHLGLGVV